MTKQVDNDPVGNWVFLFPVAIVVLAWLVLGVWGGVTP